MRKLPLSVSDSTADLALDGAGIVDKSSDPSKGSRDIKDKGAGLGGFDGCLPVAGPTNIAGWIIEVGSRFN